MLIKAKEGKSKHREVRFRDLEKNWGKLKKLKADRRRIEDEGLGKEEKLKGTVRGFCRKTVRKGKNRFGLTRERFA